jgi:hypothetical protein
MIPVFIPMPEKRGLSEGRGFTRLLESQTVPVEIFVFRTPGEDNGNKGHTSLRESGERASRKLCQEKCSEISPLPEYIIMCDGDRVCCDSNNDYSPMLTNAEDCLNFLKANNDFGGISITYPSNGREQDDKNPHIDIGWAMYRTDLFLKLDFNDTRNLCVAVTDQIRKMGYRFGYLDKKNRITHI